MVSELRPELVSVDLNDYGQLIKALSNKVEDKYSAISTDRFNAIVDVLVTKSKLEDPHALFSVTLEKSYRLSKQIDKKIAITIFSSYFESICKRGFDLNAPSYNSEVMLSYAVRSQCPFIVQAVIDAKADVNARFNNQETALYVLAEEGSERQRGFTELHKESLAILLNNGCDLNISTTRYNDNRKNLTPLDRALGDSNCGHEYRFECSHAEKLVKALVDAKADVNPTNELDKMPYLHHSLAINYIKILVDAGADLFATFEGLTAYKTAQILVITTQKEIEEKPYIDYFGIFLGCQSEKVQFLESEMKRYKSALITCLNESIRVKVLIEIVFQYLGCDDFEPFSSNRKRKVDYNSIE